MVWLLTKTNDFFPEALGGASWQTVPSCLKAQLEMEECQNLYMYV